ncbi:MAG: phosphoglycerate kinase [Candidatus Zambryskibacteria bacterium]|nr:phosphoglycerate kinase [Candidatus Zambryskibacteria bacterium]
MKSIKEAEIKAGTRVFVRVDWNVALDERRKIINDARIKASLPTISYIKEKGGVPIIASHFGRKGESIQPVIEFAKSKYPELSEGVEFLENLRQDKGEEENSENFAKKLADLAEIYINEAFPASHREHASIVGLPKLLPHFAGFRFLEEYENLSKVFKPEHPFLVIFGGAKFETKLPLVEKFLNKADDIFIGGGLHSRAKKDSEMQVKLDELSNNPKIIFPVGNVCALDANAETLEILKEKITSSRLVLWNGPLGNYEKGFIAGTNALARMLADSSAYLIIGGGDTLATVSPETECDIAGHGFISMAGGAMLEFLADETLPGIEALNN